MGVAHPRAGGGPVEVLREEDVHDREHDRALGQLAWGGHRGHGGDHGEITERSRGRSPRSRGTSREIRGEVSAEVEAEVRGYGRRLAVDPKGARVLVPDAALGLGVEVGPVPPQPVLELEVDLVRVRVRVRVIRVRVLGVRVRVR